MNKPSSTITAAFLTAEGIAVFWSLITAFTTFEPTIALVSHTIAFGSGLVGYFKAENVLPVGNRL